MFHNVVVGELQKWNEQRIGFEPDSSPEAWKYYKEYYAKSINANSGTFSGYDFENLCFVNHYKDLGLKCGKNVNGKWLNYINSPHKQGAERLFALGKQTTRSENYIEASYRLSGECDFNFNEKKVSLFRNLIGGNKEAERQLDRCREMHHTLLNFSLMQSLGNMQGYKGQNSFDRLDTFVFKLDEYFRKKTSDVLSASSDKNKLPLSYYLNCFNDIYAYCEQIYFIENHLFVDKIIEQGEMSIKDRKDVIRYMSLAEEFWGEKERCLLKKELITVGGYFLNGGETYTLEELLYKIQGDIGCDISDGKKLIDISVERGYIFEASKEVFFR